MCSFIGHEREAGCRFLGLVSKFVGSREFHAQLSMVKSFKVISILSMPGSK